MDDSTCRQEEMLALLSIYDVSDVNSPVRIIHPDSTDPTTFSIVLDIDLEDEIVLVTTDDKSASCSHLPPVTLHVKLPHDYPSTNPPTLTVHEELWTDERFRTRLHDQLQSLFEENRGYGVLFAWITHCLEEAFVFQGEHSLLPRTIDCLKLSENDVSDAARRHTAILTASAEVSDRSFARSLHECSVCLTDDLPGTQAARFRPCLHVFCMECVRQYFTMHVTAGTLSHLGCLMKDCKSIPTPEQIRLVLNDQELYERYDSLTLARGLEQMTDVARCPRPTCDQPVIVEIPPDSALPTPDDELEDVSTGRTHETSLNEMHVMLKTVTATCAHCHYSFCTYCRKSNHGVSPCSITANDRQAIMDKYERGTPAERAELEQRYGKQTLQRIIQDAQNMHWIKDNAKPCPRCNTQIEKNDGCNKITCSKCGQHFCWMCNRRINTQNPYDHFNNAANKECFQQLFQGVVDDDVVDHDWFAR